MDWLVPGHSLVSLWVYIQPAEVLDAVGTSYVEGGKGERFGPPSENDCNAKVKCDLLIVWFFKLFARFCELYSYIYTSPHIHKNLFTSSMSERYNYVLMLYLVYTVTWHNSICRLHHKQETSYKVLQ